MDDPITLKDILERMEEGRHVWEDRADEDDLPLPDLDSDIGCGWHGCVFETDDPNIVVKFTTDPSESSFWKFQGQHNLPGFAEAYAGVSLPQGFLTWRERVDLCCAEAVKSLQTDLGVPGDHWINTPWYRALSKYEDALYFKNDPRKALDQLAHVPGGQDLAVGLEQAYRLDMTFSDFHETNMGRNFDSNQLMIFDIQARGAGVEEN